ncbi:MAG: hypothetical protein AB7V58_00065 [Solirubrobacterales bacterium]
MGERLRALLERPLDPSLCRVVLLFACAVSATFAALVALGAIGSGRTETPLPPRPGPTASAPAVAPIAPSPRSRAGVHRDTFAPPEQDPQDREGSAAHRRAERQLASHRALQHVPYRRGDVTIELVGARGRRAVLRVSATSAAATRAGWRRFLRRFRDAGRVYAPIFETGRGGRG